MSNRWAVLALCVFTSVSECAQLIGPPWPDPASQPRPEATQSGGFRASAVVVTDLPETPMGPGAAEASPVIKTRQRFSSGRDMVLVDILRPRAPGRYPAVILLHGSEPRLGENLYYDMATDLAKNGFVCLFVRYYDRGHRGRGTRAQWTHTVGDALTFAATLPDVDQSKMALLGYSLGAFLSLTYAPTDERVQAVVAYYGGVQPCDMPNALKHMPPTLLLHGTYDRTVSVNRSIEAFQQLRLKALPVDVVIYPEIGHGFTLHTKGGWDEVVAQDSWARAIAFLNFHLKYPAWAPEVALPDPSPLADDMAQSTSSKRDIFAGLPTLKMPYLEQIDAQRGKILVDPTPDELKSVLTRIPQQSRRPSHRASPKGKAKQGASTKVQGTAKAKAKPQPKAPSKGTPAPKAGTAAGTTAAPPPPQKK